MPGSDFLQLDPTQAPKRGRTRWLVERLHAAIADRTLPLGTRLPATRVLAEELSMARGTVAEAYQRLVDEGLLATNRGGGTTVVGTPHAATPVAPEPASRDEGPGLLDISSGLPDLTAFPRAAWLKAERQALTTASSTELGYADPQGAPRLRVALADWLTKSRGVTVQPDQVIVTGGVTGALSLLAQVLRDRGINTCAVEDPGAQGNRLILNHWLAGLTNVPVDEDGLDVDALAATNERAVLVTPAHQFPTGVVLAPSRRRDLIDWADNVDGLVIEDDYDSEYRYDRAPVRALQASAPDRVAHISSLSKVLAPAIRLGWLVAPQRLHDDLVRTRWATDLGSPVLPQLALATLIESGALDQQLRILRHRHRERRDAAVAAIARYLPGCTVDGVAAGLHLLVRLPSEISDAGVAERARARGIAVQALSQHRQTPGTPGLVIGYGPHAPSVLMEAIRALGSALS